MTIQEEGEALLSSWSQWARCCQWVAESMARDLLELQ